MRWRAGRHWFASVTRPSIDIDDNPAERYAARGGPGIARTTCWPGTDAGGERAAAIYSLIGTAKLNGLDPEAYLREVLERVAEHTIDGVDELLPWTLAEALRKSSSFPSLPDLSSRRQDGVRRTLLSDTHVLGRWTRRRPSSVMQKARNHSPQAESKAQRHE